MRYVAAKSLRCSKTVDLVVSHKWRRCYMCVCVRVCVQEIFKAGMRFFFFFMEWGGAECVGIFCMDIFQIRYGV